MLNQHLHGGTENPILSVECPICLDGLYDQEFITFEKCSHRYHITCINSWRETKTSFAQFVYQCPTCREDRDIDIGKSMFQQPARQPVIDTGVVVGESIIQRLRRCLWPF